MSFRFKPQKASSLYLVHAYINQCTPVNGAEWFQGSRVETAGTGCALVLDKSRLLGFNFVFLSWQELSFPLYLPLRHPYPFWISQLFLTKITVNMKLFGLDWSSKYFIQ